MWGGTRTRGGRGRGGGLGGKSTLLSLLPPPPHPILVTPARPDQNQVSFKSTVGRETPTKVEWSREKRSPTSRLSRRNHYKQLRMQTQNVVSEGVKGLNEREGRGHFRFQKLSERVRGIRSVNASREVAWSESLDDAAASSGGLVPRGAGRTAAEAGALDGTFFLAKLKEVAEVNTTGQCR